MNEMVRISAKMLEGKRENKTSQIRNNDILQSKNSLVNKIWFLQKTIGNQAVQRLIKSGALQAKLMVGQPGDKYEQEADRVAEQVLRMPASMVQLQNDNNSSRTHEISPDIEAQLNLIHGSGQPLPEPVRGFFEPRLGYDLSQVRIHTDAPAAEAARAVNAQAYTVGCDIVFGAGQYTPNAPAGKWLIAHELTHVGQQGLQPQHLRAQGPVSQSSAPNQAKEVAKKYGFPEKIIPKNTKGWSFDAKSGDFILTMEKELEIKTKPEKKGEEEKQIKIGAKIIGTIKKGELSLKEGFSVSKPGNPWAGVNKIVVKGDGLEFYWKWGWKSGAEVFPIEKLPEL